MMMRITQKLKLPRQVDVRDGLILLAMFALVPLAMGNAFVAYLLWGWTGLISLPNYLYGFMLAVPFVQVFAILTLVLIVLHRDTQTFVFKLNRTAILLSLFAAHAAFVALFAYPDVLRNVDTFTDIVKTVLFCVLMPLIVFSRWRLHALLLVIVLGLSFHGMLDGLKFLASGGSHNVRGVAKFGDNNHFAVALSMVIPFLLYMVKYSKSRLAKTGFSSVALLTLLAVIGTHSRGGLLTLGAIAVWLIWQSQRKALGLVILASCFAIVLAMAPDSWSDRMSTIQSAEEDSSFMGRVAVWKKSSAIALENPVFGGGFFAVQSLATFDKFRYSQGLLGFVNTGDPGRKAAHSIYFQVMGDAGFVGLLIYLALLFNVFYTRIEVKRLAKARGAKATWAVDLSNALGAGMVAFVVGGAALSAAYFEMPFLIMALMETTRQILIQSSSNESIDS